MNKMLKDAAILFIITLISGAVLGGVYELTKEPIRLMEEAAKVEAKKAVFADAVEFKDVFESGDGATALFLASKEDVNASIDEAAQALDASGNILGYVVTVTSHEGYGGDIQFTVGVQNDGTINGVSILKIGETAGLGMQAEPVLVPQFANKKVDQFVYTKTGASADNEIDAISGATITTNAFTNGVNLGLSLVQSGVLEGGAN